MHIGAVAGDLHWCVRCVRKAPPRNDGGSVQGAMLVICDPGAHDMTAFMEKSWCATRQASDEPAFEPPNWPVVVVTQNEW